MVDALLKALMSLPLLSFLAFCCQAQADEAVKTELSVTSELYSNLQGGQRQASTGLTNAYLSLQGDGGRLFALPGLTLFTQGLLVRGGNPSSLTGDAQGASNIAAPHLTRLYEAWGQYNTANSRWSLLAGLYDLNSEFDRLQSASLFLNSSFGIDPGFAASGPAGPSIFPATSVGLRVDFKPHKDMVWRSAVLDDTPVYRDGAPNGPFTENDGLLWVSEWAWLGRQYSGQQPQGWQPDMVGRASALAPYDDKLAIGFWGYSHRQPALKGLGRSASRGMYLLADQRLYASRKLPGRVLSGFVQAAFASPNSNRFSRYLGMGLTLTQPFATRPDDSAGIAMALARNSRDYSTDNPQQVANTETSWELSYQAVVNSWLSLQPDLQYIVHPDSRRDVPNALAFQLLAQINL